MRPLQVIPSIHRATHRIGLYIARLTQLGVTQAEAHILTHLIAAGPCTVGELHAAFAHRRSTLTSVLDRLAEKKLIAREPSEKDRRTFVIDLTAQGTALATRLHNHLRHLESRVLAAVSARDVKSFSALLAALEETLQAEERQLSRRSGAKRTPARAGKDGA
ncbi:MAG TPA: MarR family transcriptional regulator [Steroidobacter sp.]